jgi:hypothetical protein
MLLCENKFNPLPKPNIAFATIAWIFFLNVTKHTHVTYAQIKNTTFTTIYFFKYMH